MKWNRVPFYGGCCYQLENGTKVIGFYSPTELESDCDNWAASNIPGRSFQTPEEAMAASELNM
jgi:hypothetical protein